MNNFNTEYFKKKLQIQSSVEIRVISDSMTPLISPGEILHISSAPQTLRRFDIIVFDHYNIPTCHFYWGETASGKLSAKSLKFLFPSDIPFEKEKLIGIVLNKKISFWRQILITLVSILSNR
jgi:hypothetical protein